MGPARTTAPGRQCSWSPDRIRRIFDFRSACSWHDWCYRTQARSRYRCDVGFYSRMRTSCYRYHGIIWTFEQWGRRAICLRLAGIYYRAVRRWGWAAYYF
ncbi:MAG: phospholipase A2 [Nocardioidaceae bacterium]